MRIVWHMPTLRGTTCGLSMRAIELAKRLQPYGHTITFVVDEEKTDIAADEVEGMGLRRLSISKRRPLHWCLQARARRRAAESIVRRIGSDHDLMVSCQPEVVAAYACGRHRRAGRREQKVRPGRTLRLAGRHRRPVLYVCGGTTLLHDGVDQTRQASRPVLRRWPYAIDRSLKRRNESRAFAAAEAVVFDSHHTRDLVAAAYDLEMDRLYTIHGGLDEARFRPPDAHVRRAARRRLGIADDDLAVVWTGRFSPEKNLELLLKSLRHCRRPPDRVHLVGEGPTRPALVGLVRDLGLERVVAFPGEQADVRPFLHAADIFAFPSRGESFGAALVEAMACGLACVALRPDGDTVRTANDEIIEHGRSGLLVDRSRPEDLAAVLDRLAGDETRRSRLGEAARRRACEHFTWSAGARRLNDVIARLARPHLRSAADPVQPSPAATVALDGAR